MNAEAEMPRYRSHKEVHALKIKAILPDRDKPGVCSICDEPLPPDGEYVAKHKPQAGGYYVVYADGYKSWSPAAAFEEGYTLVV